MTSIGDLFTPEPRTWGMRGAPHMWRAMAERFASAPLPASQQELHVTLDSMFTELTGADPASTEWSVYVPEFAHGGMSSGSIYIAWWRDDGRKLLLDRWAAAVKA